VQHQLIGLISIIHGNQASSSFRPGNVYWTLLLTASVLLLPAIANWQTTHGQLTDHSQTSHRQPTNNSRTTNRQPTDNPQTTHRQLMVTLFLHSSVSIAESHSATAHLQWNKCAEHHLENFDAAKCNFCTILTFSAIGQFLPRCASFVQLLRNLCSTFRTNTCPFNKLEFDSVKYLTKNL